MVNTNAVDIPGSFVRGTVKPEMTEAQSIDAQIKLFAAETEAAKAADVGRPVKSFNLLPKGVPLGAVDSGKLTPDGRKIYTKDGKYHVEDK
jgi:hypothetical protein